MIFIFSTILLSSINSIDTEWVFPYGPLDDPFIRNQWDVDIYPVAIHHPTVFNRNPWIFLKDLTNQELMVKEDEQIVDVSEEISGRSPLWKNEYSSTKPSSSEQMMSKQGPADFNNNDPDVVGIVTSIVPSAVMWLFSAGMGLAGLGGAVIGLSSSGSLNLPTFRRRGRSCKSLSGEYGVCSSQVLCKTAWTERGACPSGSKCCINTTNKCGDIIKVNNTYWQSPTIVYPNSPCSVTIKIDPKILEQPGHTCQIRLELEKFVIADPDDQGVCRDDVFQVGGTSNAVPSICGFNSDQHMYLETTSSVSKMTLNFKFGDVSATREWRMKISYFSCNEESLLAPSGCLQYFTTPVGTFQTFNWIDTSKTSTRQLANQNYDICFRREMVSNVDATTLCLTPSVTKAGGKAFSLSGSGATTGVSGTAGKSQATLKDCNNDFLSITSGYDPSLADGPSNVGDRFCGERLNIAFASSVSSTICTKIQPFRIKYQTDGGETTNDSKDSPGIGNIGMSMRFDQRNA